MTLEDLNAQKQVVPYYFYKSSVGEVGEIFLKSFVLCKKLFKPT